MNRRSLVVRAASGAAALALAPRVLAAEAEAGRTAEFVSPPLVFEQASWKVLDLALESETLRATESEPITRIRDHADENAGAVERALRALGITPPPRPATKELVPLPGFHEAATRGDYLRFAVDARRGTLGAWYVAAQQLHQTDVLQVGASAMAAAAQHLVVLRGLTGAEPLAAAFETGRPE